MAPAAAPPQHSPKNAPMAASVESVSGGAVEAATMTKAPMMAPTTIPPMNHFQKVLDNSREKNTEMYRYFLLISL